MGAKENVASSNESRFNESGNSVNPRLELRIAPRASSRARPAHRYRLRRSFAPFGLVERF
jgi:hypothetical protein